MFSASSKCFYHFREQLQLITVQRQYGTPPEFQDLFKYNVLARHQYFLMISTSLVTFLTNKLHLHTIFIKDSTWLAAINWVLMNNSLPRIATLHFDSCFTDKNESISELSFYNYPQLNKIIITNMRIEKKTLRMFFDNMCKFKQTNIQEFCMLDNSFLYSQHGAQPSFLQYFRSNMFQNLRILNITNSSYLSLVDIGYALNEGLAPNMEQLILSRCDVDNVTAEFIGSACLHGHLKKLKKINLNSNRFDMRRFHNFFLSITNGICNYLEEISLRHIHFDRGTVPFIENALTSKNLKHLTNLGISGYLMENVMKNLIHCPKLEKLVLSTDYFKFSKKVFQYLFDLNLNQLQYLDITSIGILDNLHDFKFFLRILGDSKLYHLKELRLCYKKTCKTVIKKFALFLETKCPNIINIELCKHSSNFKPDIDFFQPMIDALKKRRGCNNVI